MLSRFIPLLKTIKPKIKHLQKLQFPQKGGICSTKEWHSEPLCFRNVQKTTNEKPPLFLTDLFTFHGNVLESHVQIINIHLGINYTQDTKE